MNEDVRIPDEDVLKYMSWHNFDMTRTIVICRMFGILTMSYFNEYIDEYMNDKENIKRRDLIRRQDEGILLEEEIAKTLVIMTTPISPLYKSHGLALMSRLPRLVLMSQFPR